MILLLDMNISPRLVNLLLARQVKTIHWINIGKPDASDMEIIDYAKKQNCILVTYDLDFSTILSVTQAKKPSVIQIRKLGMAKCLHVPNFILAVGKAKIVIG